MLPLTISAEGTIAEQATLHLLYVEDNPVDAELAINALEDAGFRLDWRRVDTEADYLHYLTSDLDLIISDYALPQFSGLRALKLLQEKGLDIPFILVSGTIGEETAVQVMKHGATDYLLKDRLGRLAPAVSLALDQARLRRERTAMEAERRKTEEKFSKIFQASPAAIACIEVHNGRLIEVNDQCSELFGRAREEMVGCTMGALGLWADPKEEQAAMIRLHAERRVRDYEAQFRRKSGEIRTALVAMDVCELPEEPLMVVMLTDITERKKMEAGLLRAQRMESVGRMASGIAHDMNNILAPIMMSVPLLRMGMPPKDVDRTLQTIESSAKRGANLVMQLLTFGRGTEGRRGPVRPKELIDELVRIAAQTFPKNIVVQTRVAPNLAEVQGDATQLHQVLLNLCLNARDAMPQGGPLVLSAENVQIDENYIAMNPEAKPGLYAVLSVADSGTGIPRELADRIFEPFFTTKEAGKGTGLGLATVVGIVKAHGGFVNLRSEVGKGATFSVYLPVAVVQTTTIPADAPYKLPMGKGELLLVVDDEESIRNVVRKTLTHYGYQVATATDGADGIAQYAHLGPKVNAVISDLEMPVMSGVTMIQVLRRMNPALRVMVSSGVASRTQLDQRRHELKALGVDSILVKPYTAEQILRAVHDLLAKPGA